MLVPVGCGLAFVVFVCSVFSMTCNSRVWEVMAFLWSILALLVTWVRPLGVGNPSSETKTDDALVLSPQQVGWIVEIVGFSIAKNRLKSYTDDALEGTFGNALWMHLAAAVVLLFVPLPFFDPRPSPFSQFLSTDRTDVFSLLENRLTTCLTCFGMCGAYRERRRARAGGYAPPSTGYYGGNAGWSGRFFKRKAQGSTY